MKYNNQIEYEPTHVFFQSWLFFVSKTKHSADEIRNVQKGLCVLLKVL